MPADRFSSRTIAYGSGPTSRDLELRERMALLRELEAQARLAEEEARMADPLEKAKAEATVRQFGQRRDVREVTPIPDFPFPAPSRTSPGASLKETLPAAVRKIARIKPIGPRTFTTGGRTELRQEAETVRDPNFPSAYAGRE